MAIDSKTIVMNVTKGVVHHDNSDENNHDDDHLLQSKLIKC